MSFLLVSVVLADLSSRTPTNSTSAAGAAGVPRYRCTVTLGIIPAPADSLRSAFTEAFNAAFAEGSHAAEFTGAGHDSAIIQVPVKFRLVHAEGGKHAWQGRVVVRYMTLAELEEMPVDNLAGFFAAQCVDVRVTTVSPNSPGSPSNTTKSTAHLNVGGFLSGSDVSGGSRSQRRETPDWWHQLGRASALIALEQLSHHSGRMGKDMRFVLSPVSRCP
jgi:hypothetical protein